MMEIRFFAYYCIFKEKLPLSFLKLAKDGSHHENIRSCVKLIFLFFTQGVFHVKLNITSLT